MENLKERIKAEAIRLGFSFCGLAEPRQTPHFNNYLEWINKGQYAGMEYLAKEYVINGRRQPDTLLKGAQSVIVAGIHYIPQISLHDIHQLKKEGFGLIAAYGCLPDYHQTIRELFRELIKCIEEMIGHVIESRIFIDSGPVMEKDFAAQAGLGWIGRNSLLITPPFGSFCLLGCLFVDIDLPPDLPLEGDICGDCEICVQTCPTGCINRNRTINAKQCISYQTIENRADLPDDLKKKINGWVFGCDVCQVVCPINQAVVEKRQREYSTVSLKKFNQGIDLSAAEKISAESFEKRFSDTPVARIGINGFRRNINNASLNCNK
jgi:epoxyqueuosine reductase